jgi:hypothetical protein
MPFAQTDEIPLFDSRLFSQRAAPEGLWLGVEAIAMYGDKDEYSRIQVIWRFAADRDPAFNIMRPRQVVRSTAQCVEPFVAGDWIIGLRHKGCYNILIDVDFHQLRDTSQQVEISFITVPIGLLDVIAKT